MGWAWHKLYPRTSTSIVCPRNPYDNSLCLTTGLGAGSGGLCIGVTPPQGGGGGNLGVLYDCTSTIAGPNCSFEVVPPQQRTNPGCPVQYRFEIGLFCTGSNTNPGQNNQQSIDPCDYEQNSSGFPYYYASPSSPSSPPANIRKMPMCLTYDMAQIPDRIQVISGFNRYRYGGYMAPGANCSAPYSMIRQNIGVNPQQLIVGALPDGDVIHGVTGISGMEVSLGRPFPLSDTVLTYPLFGGLTSANPISSDGCPVSIPNLETCSPNGGSGHYSSNNSGAQKGSYSFQCFNAHSYFSNDSIADAVVGIPTCSVWSLLHAIYYNIDASNLYLTSNSNASNKIKPDWWKTVSPTGLSADGTQMVRWVINRFAEGVAENFALNSSTFTASFTIPNVFLWDKASFDSETTTANRWKHIYVVGNANILMDTSCTANAIWNGSSYGSSTARRNQIMLDECNHKGELNSIHNARMLSWYGCRPNAGDNPSDGGHASNNPNSVNTYSITSLGCVPENSDANGGSYCPQCGIQSTQTLKDCPQGQYNGHVDGDGVPMDGCDARA